MKQTSDYYAEIGLKAARRAALKVLEQARRDGQSIPVWRNNRVEHEIPNIPEDLAALVKKND